MPVPTRITMRESGDQFHHSKDLFWFHENAKTWASGFYCRKCLQDFLHVSPEGRTSCSAPPRSSERPKETPKRHTGAAPSQEHEGRPLPMQRDKESHRTPLEGQARNEGENQT